MAAKKETNRFPEGNWVPHVIPVNDALVHIASPLCWCHPHQSKPSLWSHNARDGREGFERANGRTKPALNGLAKNWAIVLEPRETGKPQPWALAQLIITAIAPKLYATSRWRHFTYIRANGSVWLRLHIGHDAQGCGVWLDCEVNGGGSFEEAVAIAAHTFRTIERVRVEEGVVELPERLSPLQPHEQNPPH